MKNQKTELFYKEVGDRKLALTFMPPLAEKFKNAPVYFLIPGGGWHYENREDMINFAGDSVEKLRLEGYAVAAVDYRVVTEPGIVMRDCVKDCFDAARYLAHYSKELKIDAKNIVVCGHSAGAHLALMLSYAPSSVFREENSFEDEFKIKAAAPISAPTILYEENMPKTLDLGDLWECFIGCDTLEERKALSPITYVKADCPATLLCAGTADPLVYCASSRLLYEELKRNGVESRLVLSEGGGHCFEQIYESQLPDKSLSDIMDIVTEFILNRD